MGTNVTILEAGKPFKPFTRHLTLTEPIRRLGLLGDERTIKRIFPYMNAFRSNENLVLVRGITTGGSTVISCGNMVRADKGLKEIGLDLTPEFEELEERIDIKPIPLKRWRPLTRKMYDSARDFGVKPSSNTESCKIA